MNCGSKWRRIPQYINNRIVLANLNVYATYGILIEKKSDRFTIPASSENKLVYSVILTSQAGWNLSGYSEVMGGTERTQPPRHWPFSWQYWHGLWYCEWCPKWYLGLQCLEYGHFYPPWCQDCSVNGGNIGVELEIIQHNLPAAWLLVALAIHSLAIFLLALKLFQTLHIRGS